MIFVIFTCELHLTCILYVVVEISLSFSFLFYTCCNYFFCFFFFQAEDGIRDLTVTGVHKCALPISRRLWHYVRRARPAALSLPGALRHRRHPGSERAAGRALRT